MQTDFDVVGSYNNQRVTSIDAERSINVFEYIDQRGKKEKSLIYTSGITSEIIQPGGTPIIFPGSPVGGFRGHFVFGNGNNYRQYVVIGQFVYQINTLNVATQINVGNLLLFTSGYVGIDANQAAQPQIFFTENDGATGAGYIFNTVTGVFVRITDPSFPGNSSNQGYPVDATYLDGFFITGNGLNNSFYLSEFNNGLVWGPTGATGSFTFTMAGGGNTDIVLTTGSNANFQVGTPVTFPASTVAELVPGTTYYVVFTSGAAIIRVSATPGGAPIASAAGGAGTITNNGQLQRGEITSHPGTIVACRTLHRRLFLFSQNFTEVWENQGIGFNLPFRRNNTLLMEYGCPSIASIRVGFDKMFFLSQDKDGLGAVMMVDGAQAIPVSTRALDFQLAQYASLNQVSDSWGILIKENGIIFYRLNFTAANHTFVYNVTLSNPLAGDEGKKWHEEETLGGNRHRAQTHGYFNGLNYYGDYANPVIYLVDNSYLTNDGEAIPRIRITRAFVFPGYERLRVDRLHLDLVQGQVDDVPDNVAPIVYLSVSKDGGQSYGNRLPANMGQIGERTFRTVWRKIGVTPRGQAFVCKFEFFNQVPFVILGGAWHMEHLPE